MPCYHPLRAWRSATGGISIGKETPGSTWTPLPCGRCHHCRSTYAKHWALRCHLELQDHSAASFITLTYDERHCPLTLSKRHFQLWLKRLRRSIPTRLRFFASGEYGEENSRPHYHALLFGAQPTAAFRDTIHDSWGLGRTQTKPVTPRRIAYCAGYTAAKLAARTPDWLQDRLPEGHGRQSVDPQTGEVIWLHQRPFRLMSRNPGLGSTARQHSASWALHAISPDGRRLSVPRYYKDAFQRTASFALKSDAEFQQFQYSLTRHNYTQEELDTLEIIATRNQALRNSQQPLSH